MFTRWRRGGVCMTASRQNLTFPLSTSTFALVARPPKGIGDGPDPRVAEKQRHPDGVEGQSRQRLARRRGRRIGSKALPNATAQCNHARRPWQRLSSCRSRADVRSRRCSALVCTHGALPGRPSEKRVSVRFSALDQRGRRRGFSRSFRDRLQKAYPRQRAAVPLS